MSFRLRIFTLVMLVAVTAIGATAWLTLSLTSREAAQAEQAEQAFQNEIVAQVAVHGRRTGRWTGVDPVLAGLSESTGLHIQLRSADGHIVADTDAIAQRASGPLRGASVAIDPAPALSPALIRRAAQEPLGRAEAPAGDLFGPEPPGSLVSLAMREALQYRAALLAVRCIADRDRTAPELAGERAPFLTPQQVTGHPGCVGAAVRETLGDRDATADRWAAGAGPCAGADGASARSTLGCLKLAFELTVSGFTAEPLQLYLGRRAGTEVRELGSPALMGGAALILLTLIGTALIARRVSQPVRRLTDASHQLAGGNLDVRVPVRGRSELARLTESFNAMAEAVQRSEERQRRLVADVAHELRTPLSNLRGYLEGLSDGVVEPSRELFASLHEETLLQRRILDDLQVLALAEVGDLGYNRAPTDLAELAAMGVTAHRAVAAERGVALTLDAPAPAWIDADPDRMRQVIGNLLTNAIRYTDRGGHVLIQVRDEFADAVLLVQDNGVGIEPSDLVRVFDRFWRADPARQRTTGGSGLGLTIAHRIVTDHGGRIDVKSRPDEGTTFTVHLPLRP